MCLGDLPDLAAVILGIGCAMTGDEVANAGVLDDLLPGDSDAALLSTL